MTRLVVSATGPTNDMMRWQADEALSLGADLIEFRLDLLEDIRDFVPVGRLIRAAGAKCIVTCRALREGGQFDRPESERLVVLRAAAECASGLLDIELDTWQRESALRDFVNAWRSRGEGRGLILSHHDFQKRPDNLQQIARDAADADIVKIAWRSDAPADSLIALDMARDASRPTAAMVMGEAGVTSRALAKKAGAALLYASLRSGAEAAPGQISIRQLQDVYRWDEVNTETAFFGVIGDPVAHSLSPAIHNAAFEALGLNARYLPIRVPAGDGSFDAFLQAVRERPWLGAVGFSVTIPHKISARKTVGGRCDESGDRIGAINTLKLNGGGVEGLNTDWIGARSALVDVVKPERAFRGMTAAVLGAGGVARAVVVALQHLGCHVTVVNRCTDKADAIMREFGCSSMPWEARHSLDTQLIVNCTSVGMSPNIGESPLDASFLTPNHIVFDTVYRPRRTRLLQDAAAAGATIISGDTMFLHQAERQFEYWTGRRVPTDVMQLALDNAMAAAARF